MPKWWAISWTTVIRISSSSTVGIVAELLLERDPVDGDLVRQDAGVALGPALGERDAVVEAEEVGVLPVLVLDDDLHVRHRLAELRGQGLERRADVVFELHRCA